MAYDQCFLILCSIELTLVNYFSHLISDMCLSSISHYYGIKERKKCEALSNYSAGPMEKNQFEIYKERN